MPTERGEKQKKSSIINGLKLITSRSTASLFVLCLKIILQIPKSVQQTTFFRWAKHLFIFTILLISAYFAAILTYNLRFSQNSQSFSRP